MQKSTNVMARIVNACYCSKSNGLGVDFDTLEWGQAAWGNAVRQSYNTGSNPNDYVYGIGSFTMYFDVDTQQDASPTVTMSFSGENTMVGARIHQRGGLVEILSKNALPTGGGMYTVSDNGILQLKASGCSSVHDGIASGKTLLCAIRGGVIRQNAEYVLDGDSQKIYLDNGILELLNKGGQGTNSFNDSYTYVNHITLANGSRVIGKRARVSYCVNDAIWRVTGTSPSVIEPGLALASTTGQRVTFDVEDVTGNGEPDLTVANTIVTYDTSHHTNVVFIKAGDGTMCLEAPVRLYTPMRLDAGTLLLDDSGILKGNFPAVSITFNGGTLAAAAGTSNAVGTVSVTKDSTIVVGEGAVFTFPDCSAEEWTSDKTLTISGEVDKTSVRFGTDSSALTAQQQKALRINGERAMLNAEGYVRLGISGLRFFVK